MNISKIPIYELNEDNVQHYASIIYDTVFYQVSEYSQYVDSEVQDRSKIEEISMEAILGMKYRRGKVQYLVKWETIDEAEWIDADKCDKQLIKKYLEESKESSMEENRLFYDFEKVVCYDDCGDLKKDTCVRIKKLCKGEWEDQVEKVVSMFKHAVTEEWKNGSRSAHPNKEVNIKCPQKIINYYESRIVFGKIHKK
ncbi:hypothetical protein C1645_736554 [Glomus cerebriforme]|uniref:Chromo domain-containing protein n=1 Tax=Glomus cerebriforme TaxID=658196 RepID=A0A397T7A6_9GLOM|nr:hypothetical protein C1645_736554 [Glomus cerebriforme]